MKIKYSKIRYMTLLELMIAASLTIGLLIILGYFYRQSIFLDREGEILQKASFQARYVETRLMEVIPMIERNYLVNNNPKGSNYYFFSESDLNGQSTNNSSSLVFIYKTDYDFHPEYSVHALGKLFVDKQNRLMLATWPAPETWEEKPPTKAKLEVLLENVSNLQFLFFNPPAKDNLDPKDPRKKAFPPLKMEQPLNTTDSWLREWKQEYLFLPPMIKIMIRYKPFGKKEEETTTYAFPIPSSSKVVLYD